MREQAPSGIGFNTPVTVLLVSPMAEDHTSLTAVFDRVEKIPGANSEFILRPCASVEAATAAMSQARIPIVVTERDLPGASWRDILDRALLLPGSPVLIVTSRLADEYLWAEALNLGAYDVLAKPFDAQEVIRVIGSAWRHWTDLHRRIEARNLQPMVAMTAA